MVSALRECAICFTVSKLLEQITICLIFNEKNSLWDSLIFSVGIVVVLVPYLRWLNKSWSLAVGGDYTGSLLSFIQCRYLFCSFPDYT